MQHRIRAITVAAVLLCALLAGCGRDKAANAGQGGDRPVAVTTTVVAPAGTFFVKVGG